MPELVTNDEDGYKAVNYSKLPLLATQAIKELKEKNDALERRLAAIEGPSADSPPNASHAEPGKSTLEVACWMAGFDTILRIR